MESTIQYGRVINYDMFISCKGRYLAAESPSTAVGTPPRAMRVPRR